MPDWRRRTDTSLCGEQRTACHGRSESTKPWHPALRTDVHVCCSCRVSPQGFLARAISVNHIYWLKAVTASFNVHEERA